MNKNHRIYKLIWLILNLNFFVFNKSHLNKSRFLFRMIDLMEFSIIKNIFKSLIKNWNKSYIHIFSLVLWIFKFFVIMIFKCTETKRTLSKSVCRWIGKVCQNGHTLHQELLTFDISILNDEPGMSKLTNFMLFLYDEHSVSPMTHQFD